MVVKVATRYASLSDIKNHIMRTVIALMLLAICTAAHGQSFILKGEILDEKAQPLTSVAVVLLSPVDSTLLYFSITGNTGRFEMKNIKKDSYLLQVSLLGYKTLYQSVTLPSGEGEDIGQIVLVPRVFNIDEVQITGERIPMKIRKDTIEYDAKAFKVKPDAVAEDLVKKLPGIEVDRAGNIKALGEDVENVLVDGKEFFGNDPKVATRNLPASAINKVQLYDRATDESKFTGIDDGERNPTLNFVLEEGKKSGIFGDILGGAGTDSRAQASGKLYRFTRTTQFAALGMYNNINQLGFSLGDYINFSGGIQRFSSGDGHVIIGDNSFPVNFGQPVYGTGSNGAAGMNFSISPSENNRFFMSYLGNGSRRKLAETSSTRNYTPDRSFVTDEKRGEIKTDTSHRFNFGVRKLIGEKQNLIINGGLSFNSASDPLNSLTGSRLNEVMVNNQLRNSNELASRLSGNADASYLLKINEGKTIFKVAGRVGYSGNDSRTRFNNMTEYFNPYRLESVNQFYNVGLESENYSGSISFTQKITRQSFLDFSIASGYSNEDMNRKQGNLEGSMMPVEILSPDFSKTDNYLRPGITWKLSTTKTNLTLAMLSNLGEYTTKLNNDAGSPRTYSFLNPRASWEYSYRSGRRFMIDYNTSVVTPRVQQLLPVVNNLNPLALFYGNRNLKPEYVHNARLSWWLFDQFSFTTLLTSMNMRYTLDKIGYSRTVDENLGQVISVINVKDDWSTSGMVDFSTPIKPLGIKVNLVIDEEYNRGLSLINNDENINSRLTHRISLTLGNRKKEKWDIETGSNFTVTNSKYSVQKSLNDIYNDISVFTELRYTPNIHFNFMGSADVTNYSSKNFSQSQLIPLLNTEISYYLLKNQRGVLTLAGVDLLNRNTGIERMSEMNTFSERRSSIIGRYFMLSFKYRLNKVGENKDGVDIRIRQR